MSGEHKREGGVEIGGGEDGEERGGVKTENRVENIGLEARVEARTSLKDRVGMDECFLRSLLILGQKDLGFEERDLKKQGLSFLT